MTALTKIAKKTLNLTCKPLPGLLFLLLLQVTTVFIITGLLELVDKT